MKRLYVDRKATAWRAWTLRKDRRAGMDIARVGAGSGDAEIRHNGQTV